MRYIYVQNNTWYGTFYNGATSYFANVKYSWFFIDKNILRIMKDNSGCTLRR